MYEWDENKNRLNLEKHGLDFNLAIEVFSDPNSIVEDNREINGEIREQIIGKIDNKTTIVLFVVYTKRGKAIRIISARKASKRERYMYENQTRTN